MNDIRARFNRAINNLAFLDDIASQIVISKLYQEREKGNLPLLADLYEFTEKQVIDEATFEILGDMEGWGWDKGKEKYSGYEKGFLEPVLRKEKEWKETGEVPRELLKQRKEWEDSKQKFYEDVEKYIDDKFIPQAMAIKCRMIDYMSKVVQ